MPDEKNLPETEEDAGAQMRRLSRRSFLWAAAASGGGVGGLWAFNQYAPEEDGAKAAFRRVFDVNETVARRVFFSTEHRAQEFPRSAARKPRNNYRGATPIIDPAAWRLRVEGVSEGGRQPVVLTLADIRTLPEVSQTTELKCIEGWSTVVNWTGVRLLDFIQRYPAPPGTPYVSMRSEPPGWEDDWYYVGLDIESCLHPQALLAYAMNDEALTPEHGAPLRLVMPHKYGIKNIKLITSIAYSAARPADFWAEQGYDWYAGL